VVRTHRVAPRAARAGPHRGTRDAFGIGGVGGSFAYADRAAAMAFALTKNRLRPDFSAATRIIQLVAEELAETSRR
jgi:CubicO group peptidase (beta-lactamase class C family)